MKPVQARGRSLSTLLRRYWRDRRGASAIELAFALPVYLILVAGIIEVSLMMLVNVLAEGGLREAARYGITGRADCQGAAARELCIAGIVNQHTLGFLDIGIDDIEMLAYAGGFPTVGQAESFTDTNGNGTYDNGEPFTDSNGNGSWDSDQGATGAGDAGDVVLYRLDYDWDFIVPLFDLWNSFGDSISMSASIAVRNEPYNDD